MQKYNRCVSIAKKAVRYAPPLFAQIAMFVASRVLKLHLTHSTPSNQVGQVSPSQRAVQV
jgi:hypothetical protein